MHIVSYIYTNIYIYIIYREVANYIMCVVYRETAILITNDVSPGRTLFLHNKYSVTEMFMTFAK
jgi:hypothetical protein